MTEALIPIAAPNARTVLAAVCLALMLTGSPSGAGAQGLAGPSSIDPAEGGNSGLPGAGTGVTNPGSVDPGDQGGGGGGEGDGKGKSDAPPPPPALPGSHARPTAVAPADKVVADMDPTSALFDAINRGDTVAVRDAISRGANLDGHNVLGLTPIELSVDLNRNDISFLLLSMRGATESTSVKAKAHPLPGAVVAREGRRVRVAAGARQTPAVAGAADPDAGFLGFGGRGPS